jgi:dCTP deaminase
VEEQAESPTMSSDPEIAPRRRRPQPKLFKSGELADDAYFNAPYGLFARQKIKAMAARKLIQADRQLEETQFQPASLDLRLGREAFRVRASFLPGRGHGVRERLKSLNAEPVSLADDGAVLEKGIVYVARLAETLHLLPSLSGAANPKSSTGRLDIFTRLIVDGGDVFDAAPLGYHGELWLEVSPRSFSVRAREGSRLNQIRFRSRNSQQFSLFDFAIRDDEIRARHAAQPLVDGALMLREGLVVSVALSGAPGEIVGYRAIKNGDVIDVDKPQGYAAADFWEPIRARPDGRLILDPDEFYILASREKLQIPSDLAAEMAPIDPAIGEFRVHYAGFFDPGFGQGADGAPCARAVLEVRSRDVPFLIEDGQPVGRLIYEKLAGAADELYGAGEISHYQGQGLKLAKHFRDFVEP